LFNRLPNLQQIARVYAIIVLMVYSWTLLVFFWKLPSWLYFMSSSEILVIFAYGITLDFFESLSVLLLPIIICFLLPQKWFYDSFIARGASLATLVVGYVMFLTWQLQSEEGYPKDLLLLTFPVLIVISFLVYLAGKISPVNKAITFFADRAVVFLYLSIPVNIILFIVVAFRNLFID
jgi:hypothetical protein